jgi:ketosteroid isomerase-like protein
MWTMSPKIAAASLIVACSRPTAAVPPAPPVDWRAFPATRQGSVLKDAATPAEREAADLYVTDLMTPRLRQLASQLDADASGSFCGSDAVVGRDRVVELHEMLFGAFEDRRIVATRVFRTASAQAVEWTMTGLQARDWMQVAATHRPVAFRGITLLWTKDDGTITDAHVYFDTAVVKGQLGVGPRELVDLPRPSMPAAEQRLEQMHTPVEMANVATVRAQLDALEARDESSYLSFVTDDLEVFTPERSDALRGKVAARTYYEALDHAIGQLDTTVRQVWGIASFVVVEYSIAGVQLAPIGRVPLVRDHVVGLHIVDVAQLRDERIERIWRYDNLAEVAAGGPAR